MYVVFHWLTSEYMQLASCFMKLAAAGRRHNQVHFHGLFEGKMLMGHFKWDNCIQNFHLGRCIVGYMVGNLVLQQHVTIS